jgi:uncharacterized CHY-type Zn-finger protein
MSGPWNFAVQQEFEQQPLNMALLLLQQELAVSKLFVFLNVCAFGLCIDTEQSCVSLWLFFLQAAVVTFVFHSVLSYFLCSNSHLKLCQHTQLLHILQNVSICDIPHCSATLRE